MELGGCFLEGKGMDGFKSRNFPLKAILLLFEERSPGSPGGICFALPGVRGGGGTLEGMASP